MLLLPRPSSSVMLCLAFSALVLAISVVAFLSPSPLFASHGQPSSARASKWQQCWMVQVDQAEAQSGIDKVVACLRKDKSANEELGRLDKVTQVVGFGSPTPGTMAVRFNASFRKGGFGRSSVPLPFGLGQSNVAEGRGAMVGQVKATVDSKTGKILSCSVFRDLGYGRSFNLKV